MAKLTESERIADRLMAVGDSEARRRCLNRGYNELQALYQEVLSESGSDTRSEYAALIEMENDDGGDDMPSQGVLDAFEAMLEVEDGECALDCPEAAAFVEAQLHLEGTLDNEIGFEECKAFADAAIALRALLRARNQDTSALEELLDEIDDPDFEEDEEESDDPEDEEES